ncbi:hypothetical protein M0D21_09385 [Aquimarina sp. D1M17]|uniref:hypothetical protein n=1 Tax=Aquimarina acroporae TaxID=2937283 RepID=UPI0020C1170B|nr:hypothetical protein [Aquimarina acroporae]MCK8521783.1 hypothetical protein [Aquimarina acroporae]
MKNAEFEIYKPRSILFNELFMVENWAVKIYQITNKTKFTSSNIYKNVIHHLPAWLKQLENSRLPIYKHAFLIVHEAREGIWILLNWWTGGEMIETKVFFSNFENPAVITNSPYNTNSLLCVWELEVFAHERISWIENVLKKAETPDFIGYSNDVLNKHQNA